MSPVADTAHDRRAFDRGDEPFQSAGRLFDEDLFLYRDNHEIFYRVLRQREMFAAEPPFIHSIIRSIFDSLFYWFGFVFRRDRPELQTVQSLGEPAFSGAVIHTKVHGHAYLLSLLEAAVPSAEETLRLAQQLSAGRAELLRLCFHSRWGASLWVDRRADLTAYCRQIAAHDREELINELAKYYRERYEEDVQEVLALMPAELSLTAGTAEEHILDSYTGRVDKIADGIAYVTLRDRSDRGSFAELDAEDLAASGIGDRDRFVCTVKRRGTETVLVLEKIRRPSETAEDLERIEKILDDALPDSVLNPTER